MENKRQWNLIKKCDKCGKEIEVKYNRATHEHSNLNNWGYWTQKESNEGIYKCGFCLWKLYNNEPFLFSKLVVKEKQGVFYNYVENGKISKEQKLTKSEKEKVLRIVNSPQLTFAETEQELTTILPWANQSQIQALTEIICEEIDQTKRGQFSNIVDLEGKKFKFRQ